MKPLEGIKVVELAAFVAGPAVGRLLGEWGAEVIKVEGLTGDGNRIMGLLNKMPIDDNENPSFDTTCFNKEFVCIDTKKPEGKALFHKILADADVLLTNFRSQALERMGFDYDSLKEQYPRLVFAQVLGFGEEGPEKDTAGYDFTAYGARGGLLGTVYQKGGEPINNITSFGDFQVSVSLAAGILCALLGRINTGKGDKVTASLHGTALFMLSWGILGAKYGSSYPKSRKDVNCPSINTYPANDRWLQLCGPDYNRYYNDIMRVIGRDDLIDDPRYRDLKTIQESGDTKEVIRIIEEAMRTRSSDEWMPLFRAADVPCEKAYTFEDILADEQAWASKALSTITYPTGNEGLVVATPVRMQSIGDPEYLPSRRVGHDTAEVLAKHGLSEQEIKQLADDNIIRI